MFPHKMPQTDFFQWDRVLLIKLISIIEMTFSSILFLLYTYLSILQSWTSTPELRSHILVYKWLVIILTLVDFGIGSLLAYAANLVKKHRRPKVILWIIFDTLILPVNMFVLTNMSHELDKAEPLSADVHLRRAIFVHTLYTTAHFVFILAVLNFLAYYNPVIKKYDPSARPNSVFEPTDPQITTTESRHIRFSESFLQTNVKSSDPEASTSSKSQIQLQTTISTRLGFYKISFLPLITAYCFKRISCLLADQRKGKSNDGKPRDALTEIERTNPALYNILKRVYRIKKWSALVAKERFIKSSPEPAGLDLGTITLRHEKNTKYIRQNDELDIPSVF